ncbi:unnamed protein product [Calicophoron daubneyi]|uniref:UBX domain-containing protein n=1 Tax=Calicophoron daubneyi TaxID=300641 RepID=A0AAV2TDW5_CALDB
MSDLTERFCQVTGADEATATSFLLACNNNLDMAVSLYMDDPHAAGSSTEEYRSPIPQRTEQLLPVDLPLYTGRPYQTNLIRGCRRAFVADDDDDLDDNEQTRGDGNSVGSGEDVEILSVGCQPCLSSSDASVCMSNGKPDKHLNNRGTGSSLKPVASNWGTREEAAKKRGHLRQLYQPPVGILFQGSLAAAQASAREKNQWLLVSLHDEGCFDCHLLNRDVWKDPKIYSTIKRNFVFVQIPIDSPDGLRYRSRHSYVQSASHIAVLDPFTGEQKVMWMHLKEPKAVQEVLTEFLKHTALGPSVPNDRHEAAETDGQYIASTSQSGMRRPADSCLDPTDDGILPLKRPRLTSSEREVYHPSSGTGATSPVLQPHDFRYSPVNRTTATSPLDLTEEEQLQMAIEASKAESVSSGERPVNKKNNIDGGTDTFHNRISNSDDELIILTDDEDDAESNTSITPDIDREDSFVIDPEVTSACNSTTAVITARRPLRPDLNYVTDESRNLPSASPHIPPNESAPSTNIDSFCLPAPQPGDGVIELVVRLPAGERDVIRVPSKMKLKVLRQYFESRGFSMQQFELIHLYPRLSLSNLPETTSLSGAGLSKKDTIFVQER